MESRLEVSEEHRLVRLAQAGDCLAMSRLFKAYDSMLWALAHKVRARHETVEDLHQVASMAFIECVEAFDSGRSQRLTPLICRIVPLRMRRYARMSSLVHVSKHSPRKHKDKAAQALRSPVSLNAPDAEGISLLDTMVGESDTFAAVTNAELRNAVNRGLSLLPERHREVVRLRMCGEEFREIGMRFGFTKEWARKTLDVAYEKLAEFMVRSGHVSDGGGDAGVFDFRGCKPSRQEPGVGTQVLLARRSRKKGRAGVAVH